MNRETEQQYSLLSSEEAIIRPELEQKKTKSWKFVSLVSLAFNLSFAIWILYILWNVHSHGVPINYHGVPAKDHGVFNGLFDYCDDAASEVRVYTHYSDYSSASGDNPPNLAAKWESMIDDHGLVAVDHKVAKRHHLMAARNLPSDPTKGVYLVDGYHSLHCLMLIRKAFYQSLDKNDTRTFDKSMGHYSHCFDHLKQAITCSASDHLYAVHYDYEGIPTGEWDRKKCRSWDALRRWTTRHSLCQGDVKLNSLIPHQVCSGPDDFVRLSDQDITESSLPDYARTWQQH